jgi:hypothetical protein
MDATLSKLLADAKGAKIHLSSENVADIEAL